MAIRLNPGDVSAFKCFVSLAVLYGILSIVGYSIVHMKHVKPLAFDAPMDQFSEARAVKHVRKLAKEIDGRQEGRPGLNEAARYIKMQLELLAERAGSNIRVEVDETHVDGSFNMIFLGHGISFGYRNHTNLALRISSTESKDTDPSVLVNGHFDSPLGSPGAGDCASCVASMLEIARVMVDSGWLPPRPVILLFNGAEELFMLGSHGFMETHRWHDSVGAFINVEASGTGGPDLVCQSGPGSWPSRVYAQSAIYPMAHSAAQDVFPAIPGDTDYRMFAEDYGDIPGLDIIFLLGGYFYHTSYDTVERLLPGSIQARGENLFSLINAFASSPELLNAQQRIALADAGNGTKDDQSVFFDYLSLFMVSYSRKIALVIHSLPIVIFFLMPLVLHFPNIGVCSLLATFADLMKGLLFHTIGVLLAIVVPVIFAISRLLFSSSAMNWFAHPYLAFVMFVPSSLVGLLIPRVVWRSFPISQDASLLKTSKEALSDEARFWGAFGLYATMTLVTNLLVYFSMKAYLVAGLGGGFTTFFLSAFMIPSWISFCLLAKCFGRQSLKSLAGYIVPLIPCLIYSVYFGGFLVQFVIEKMGMMGSLPHPYGANVVVDSSYDFSVVDANSLSFLFKYAPEAAKELHFDSEFPLKSANHSDRSTWVALFPVSFLFSGSLKFPARGDGIFDHYRDLPHLSAYKPTMLSSIGSRKVYLELSLGSLEEVWVSVLNITGPLSNWSFADNSLPVAVTADGIPPSYILRLSGKRHENWTFWLEANSSEAVRVDVAVLDQYLVDDLRKLKGFFPSWVDVTAYSIFLSTYSF
ncbi:uncharacterized protein LOC131246870 isoform X6 [Magnolia sinica]|uniref:uncharacterized protein LOC131246870 isoform X6 n=1 Tax=Magnolia sinica TaxID=86752 RepID=UPI00265847EB|nr:uncharacterized protein LOC131246870 isoform X6 [Magnolia sinica]